MVTARTHLWFGNNRAHEAAAFYAEHIPGSSVESVLTSPGGCRGRRPANRSSSSSR